MANKTKSLSFRAPADVRNALHWGCKQTGESQSVFIENAVQEMVARLESAAPADELLLPEDYPVSNEDSKMITVRVEPSLPELVDAKAPRLCQTNTKFLLWAITHRSLRLARAEPSKESA